MLNYTLLYSNTVTGLIYFFKRSNMKMVPNSIARQACFKIYKTFIYI